MLLLSIMVQIYIRFFIASVISRGFPEAKGLLSCHICERFCALQSSYGSLTETRQDIAHSSWHWYAHAFS
jgi:hypothetical protein